VSCSVTDLTIDDIGEAMIVQVVFHEHSELDIPLYIHCYFVYASRSIECSAAMLGVNLWR
jgi:hypothetical protein